MTTLNRGGGLGGGWEEGVGVGGYKKAFQKDTRCFELLMMKCLQIIKSNNMNLFKPISKLFLDDGFHSNLTMNSYLTLHQRTFKFH